MSRPIICFFDLDNSITNKQYKHIKSEVQGWAAGSTGPLSAGPEQKEPTQGEPEQQESAQRDPKSEGIYTEGAQTRGNLHRESKTEATKRKAQNIKNLRREAPEHEESTQRGTRT